MSCDSFCGSEHPYGGAENVWVVPIIVPEFELSDVKGEILGADLVEGAHDATLDEAPEAVNGLRMNGSDHILLAAMAHGLVWKIRLQSGVTGVFIGREQINLCRDGFPHEALQSFGVGAIDHASDDIPFALDSASNDQLAGGAASARSVATMFVLGLATDIGLIGLHNTHELAEPRINQPGPDAMAHIMRGFVGAEANHPLYFERRAALLGSQHHVDDAEPVPQPDIRVLEDRSDKHGKAITTSGSTFRTLPVESAVCDGIDLLVRATGAMNTGRPAARAQIGLTGIVIRKQSLEFADCRLFGELSFGHRSIPFV